MTREEAAMRLKEEVLDQLYYDRHMMTLKEIESWLYKHNCDEDALDVIMEIIRGIEHGCYYKRFIGS